MKKPQVPFLTFNPPVIAHRGASAYAPENTLSAFTKAGLMGVKWIEFDVILAACGEPIIFHDKQLQRTTNGAGFIGEYPYAYLQTLDAGKWFDPAFSGERIPTLKEVMDFLIDKKMNANIEFKNFAKNKELLVKSVLSVVKPYLVNHALTILFSSFSIQTLEILRSYSPDCLIGLLLHEWQNDWPQIFASLQCASIHIHEKIATKERIKNMKDKGIIVLCYTVNHPARAKQLYSWGVDALFSDAPDKIGL